MNQVRYTNADPQRRWKLPALWHSFRRSSSLGNIDFFAIDTEGLRRRENNPNQQLSDLNNALRNSNARMKLVFGHHPPYTAGRHGPGSDTIRDQVNF